MKAARWLTRLVADVLGVWGYAAEPYKPRPFVRDLLHGRGGQEDRPYPTPLATVGITPQGKAVPLTAEPHEYQAHKDRRPRVAAPIGMKIVTGRAGLVDELMAAEENPFPRSLYEAVVASLPDKCGEHGVTLEYELGGPAVIAWCAGHDEYVGAVAREIGTDRLVLVPANRRPHACR